MIRPCVAGLFLCLAFLAMPSTRATSAAQGAMDRVKSVLDTAIDIQTRKELEGEAHRKERARMVRELIAGSFASSDMAKESLGAHWKKLSSGQQAEFQKIFTDLFQDSYTRMVLNFLRKETIEYRGETPRSKGTLVQTVIMRANEHIPVDYQLAQKSGQWWIRDVQIDGVSIVENYRDTFNREISRSSFDGLLQKMRLQNQAMGREAS
ncbi:MAG: ABC transporter substrate-binding protein [Syntrophobacteraceae bacterium]|jgi:phospholipid transport system substrate-binding protein|nr:ABC transporter substrate-binding protein [Syntrophobacteraceae bacterium]